MKATYKQTHTTHQLTCYVSVCFSVYLYAINYSRSFHLNATNQLTNKWLPRWLNGSYWVTYHALFEHNHQWQQQRRKRTISTHACLIYQCLFNFFFASNICNSIACFIDNFNGWSYRVKCNCYCHCNSRLMNSAIKLDFVAVNGAVAADLWWPNQKLSCCLYVVYICNILRNVEFNVCKLCKPKSIVHTKQLQY